MNNLFENKTIALVGNANSLFEKNLGNFIDEHNTICRMNFGIRIVDPSQQGIRTDVWMVHHSFIPRQMQVQYPNTNINNIKTIICSRLVHDLETTERINKAHNLPTHTHLIDETIIENLKEKLKSKKPSTGLIMLELINNFKFEQLNLFGFDWKESKTWYHSEETNDTMSPHDWKREREFIHETYLTQRNITLY